MERLPDHGPFAGRFIVCGLGVPAGSIFEGGHLGRRVYGRRLHFVPLERELKRRTLGAQSDGDDPRHRCALHALAVDEQTVAALEIPDGPFSRGEGDRSVTPADLDVVEPHIAIRVAANPKARDETARLAAGQKDVERRGRDV